MAGCWHRSETARTLCRFHALSIADGGRFSAKAGAEGFCRAGSGGRGGVPLIVGGGIDTSRKALESLEAGADMIVIGNALEKDPTLLNEIAEKIYEINQQLKT